MQQKVQDTIEKYHMLDSVQFCYVALSGGADSVCLFHVLRGICEKRSISMGIAHVNHGLRACADADEAFVCALAERYAVPMEVERVDVAALAKERKTGVEEAGRDVRYKFFEALLKKNEGSVMAIAHTASDNAETVLFNLFRGAGINGLSGIAPVREAYIRPLIACERQEIEDYVRQEGLSYVEDESNADVSYTRNKIRHQLIPFIEKEFSAKLVEKIGVQSEILRAENAILNAYAESYIHYLFKEERQIVVDRNRLLEAEKPILYRAIQNIVKENFAMALDYTQCIFCAEQLSEGKNKCIQSLPKGLILEISYSQAVFTCKGETHYNEILPQQLALGENKIAGFGQVHLDVIKNLHFSKKKTDKYGIDYDIIKGANFSSFFLRGRKEGDAIKLSGRKTRTLKKMYIDEKISVNKRAALPVIVLGEQVICAYPFGVSHEFAPTEKTEQLLKITFNEENKNEK